jgi:hypothetical protein
MKRRETKKGLRETEDMIIDSIRLYFTRPRNDTEDKNEKLSRDIVALSLSMLLSFHLQLKSIKLSNRRWISKLSVLDLSVESPVIASGSGVIEWGEMEGNKEVSKSDRFTFRVRVTDIRRRKVEYELAYKQDGTWRRIGNFAAAAV